MKTLAFASTLSLVLVSSAPAGDAADTAPTPPAVLYFVNGDHLPGTPLDSDQTNAFLWQATDF
ncbi:MAG TPA: hypothetical protein VGX78_13085, partial [Pirellulales bacterium]|nr:hypothetical protein [Pirellulales bacterium]